MVQNLLSIKYAHILDKLNTIHITVVVKRIENCHLIPPLPSTKYKNLVDFT